MPTLTTGQAAALRSAQAVILAHQHDHPAIVRLLDAVSHDATLCDREVIRADEQRDMMACYLGIDFPAHHEADTELLQGLSASKDALLIWGLARTPEHLAMLAGIVTGSRIHGWPITLVFELWAADCTNAIHRMLIMAHDQCVPQAFLGAIIVAPTDPADGASSVVMMRLDAIDGAQFALTPIDSPIAS